MEGTFFDRYLDRIKSNFSNFFQRSNIFNFEELNSFALSSAADFQEFFDLHSQIEDDDNNIDVVPEVTKDEEGQLNRTFNLDDIFSSIVYH